MYGVKSVKCYMAQIHFYRAAASHPILLPSVFVQLVILIKNALLLSVLNSLNI